MLTLFADEPTTPPGFQYFPNFLTPSEENSLLKAVSEFELHNFRFQGFEAKRKVASFGYDYNFDQKSLNPGRPIPEVFNPLIDKVARHLGLPGADVRELLMTEYPPGSVINWHRDAFPFDLIAGISLQSDCTFRLRPHLKEKQTRGSIISIPVQRRSMYVIQGEARINWQHSIAPVKAVRYSITLRTLRDSQAGRINPAS